MIKNVADLLKAFSDEEKIKLDAQDLSHGPTIGAMYEGLTKELVEKSIPPELGLQVVSGFAYYENQSSGEIDCMLVKGKGELIPYTQKYKWPIADVIAVFEVKKSLNSEELADSYNHLRNVSTLYSDYIQGGKGQSKFNLKWPRKVFSQLTGQVAPEHGKIDNLPFDLEMIYHTLISELYGPIRITFSHHGWKKEGTLRNHIYKFIESRLKTPEGMGAGSFPQLIIGGEYSLVKANGFPYVPQMRDGMWMFLLSTNHNPLRLILELIFTKLDFFYGTNLTYDDSSDAEAMSPCLSTRAVQKEGKSGWEYCFIEIKNEHLKSRGDIYESKPIELTDSQAVIFHKLCKGAKVDIQEENFIAFANGDPAKLQEFIDSLINTQLIALNGNELKLTTQKCIILITPEGKVCVGENNDGQMINWLKNKKFI